MKITVPAAQHAAAPRTYATPAAEPCAPSPATSRIPANPTTIPAIFNRFIASPRKIGETTAAISGYV